MSFSAQTTQLMSRLHLRCPLIVAPMAGGPSSVDLVAECSNAGALGSIGAAYFTPHAISDFAKDVRSKTQRPIAINLFVPHMQPTISNQQLSRAISATAAYRTDLNLAAPILTPPFEEDFEAQLEAALRTRAEVLSFVFGLPNQQVVAAAHRESIFVIGTATNFAEAQALEEAGVDAITLQGIEAGGHRGLFSSDEADAEQSLPALLKACSQKIKRPLIAAGGLMTASDIRNAMAQGAHAVQLGTAFLACQESGTSAAYRRALLASPDRDTKTTRVFSGRLARGIKNRFITEMESKGPEAILPFPAQNKFTRDLRAASAKQDSSDFLSLWAGTGRGELWQGSCRELIESLF